MACRQQRGRSKSGSATEHVGSVGGYRIEVHCEEKSTIRVVFELKRRASGDSRVLRQRGDQIGRAVVFGVVRDAATQVGAGIGAMLMWWVWRR
jgi:hypothetical protein